MSDIPHLISPDTSPTRLAEVRRTLAAGAAEADRNARLPEASMRAVHEAGLLTATVGERFGGAGFGGAGFSAGSFVDAYAELGAGDPSVALVALMTAMQHLAADNGVVWPEELYARILRDSAQGPVLLNAARAEPSLGSSSRGGPLETTVRKSEGGWIVDGRKSFVTGAGHLAYHSVSAVRIDGRQADGGEARRGETQRGETQRGEVVRVIVPGDAPGVEDVRSWDSIGMRASNTHDVVYREVEVPDEYVLHSATAPGRGSARIGAMFGLGVSAIYLGIARASRDSLVEFLTTRVPSSLGAPLSTVERLQDETGEVTAQILYAEELLYSLAARLDAGEDPGDPRIATVKPLCTRAAIASVQTAVRAAGSHGLDRGHDLERHLRDVLCARPHPPQDDTALRRLGVASLSIEQWRSAPHGVDRG